MQPVLFSSARSELSPKAIQYKTKIAAILTDRPQLRIKICGIATSSDRNELVAQQLKLQVTKQNNPDLATQATKLPVILDNILLTIATNRADNLKGALIKDHKIAPDRLFSCLPVIDTAENAKPRVEMGI